MATKPPPKPAAAVPPAKFAAPAQPKAAALLTNIRPASHFVPHDPPQATTGVRQNPPANEQASVPDDPSLPMGLNQPLGFQPFANVPK